MDSLLSFLINYQTWIYVVLALILVIYLKKLIDAVAAWNATIFGLERDYAQKKVNSALVVVIVSVLLLVSEFISVNYLISAPQALSPLTGSGVNEEGVDLSIVAENDSAALPAQAGGTGVTAEGIYLGGCAPGILEWISPQPSEVVTGLYTLRATVNVPEMGFFRWDYAPINDPTNWNAISAQNLPLVEGDLGLLATTEIENGDYILRLEVMSKTNERWSPCDVSIRIMNAIDDSE